MLELSRCQKTIKITVSGVYKSQEMFVSRCNDSCQEETRGVQRCQGVHRCLEVTTPVFRDTSRCRSVHRCPDNT